MLTVSISPEQANQMRAAVDSGDYASGSQVVREALRLWSAVHDYTPARAGETADTDDILGESDGCETVSVSELYAAYTTRNGNA
jgi:antitoxin ParD1/3/4